MEAQAKTIEAKVASLVEKTPPPKAKGGEPRSFSQRLVSGAEQLLLLATKTATGWRTEAIVRANKVNTRGETTEYATVEQARAAIDRAVADARKLGWQLPASRGGFHRPADQFKGIPKPGATTKKGSK